jgi:hypothetical protein
MLEQGGLTGAGGRHNKAPLTLTHGSHEVDHTRGKTFGRRLQPDAFVGTDGRKFLEEGDIHVLFGIGSFDFSGTEQLNAARATTSLTFDEHTVAKVVLTDHLGCDEDVILRGRVGTLGLPKESESLSREFYNTLCKSRLWWRSILADGIALHGIGAGKIIIPCPLISMGSLISSLTRTAVIPPMVPERPATTGVATTSTTGSVKLPFTLATLALPSGIPDGLVCRSGN